VASPAMGHWGTCPPPLLDFQQFYFLFTLGYLIIWQPSIQILCSLWDQLVQMSTAHSLAFSISTASVTKLLVIEQLLHPALKFTVSAPWPTFKLCASWKLILATPLWLNTSDIIDSEDRGCLASGEHAENDVDP